MLCLCLDEAEMMLKGPGCRKAQADSATAKRHVVRRPT